VAILHGGVSGKMRWNGGGLPAVWIYNKVLSDHPTGKPDALLESWVTQFSEPGETILDPYMGAGTTLAAAKKHGRKAVGIEIEERYCEIAARRLAQGSLLGQMLDGLAAHDVIEGEK
jgi:site-specific DNA-methyltransferase (adenine-specific)